MPVSEEGPGSSDMCTVYLPFELWQENAQAFYYKQRLLVNVKNSFDGIDLFF
jgi:hypothetical protein